MRKNLTLKKSYPVANAEPELFELQVTYPYTFSFEKTVIDTDLCQDIRPLCDKLTCTIPNSFLNEKPWNIARQPGYAAIPKNNFFVSIMTKKEISSHAFSPRIPVPPSSSDNATVGLSCLFPGAKSPEEYWLYLAKGIGAGREGTLELIHLLREATLMDP